jgi:hypothetical protein
MPPTQRHTSHTTVWGMTRNAWPERWCGGGPRWHGNKRHPSISWRWRGDGRVKKSGGTGVLGIGVVGGDVINPRCCRATTVRRKGIGGSTRQRCAANKACRWSCRWLEFEHRGRMLRASQGSGGSSWWRGGRIQWGREAGGGKVFCGSLLRCGRIPWGREALASLCLVCPPSLSNCLFGMPNTPCFSFDFPLASLLFGRFQKPMNMKNILLQCYAYSNPPKCRIYQSLLGSIIEKNIPF